MLTLYLSLTISLLISGASIIGRLACWLGAIWTSLQAVIAIVYIGELIFKNVPFTQCASKVRLDAVSTVMFFHEFLFQTKFYFGIKGTLMKRWISLEKLLTSLDWLIEVINLFVTPWLACILVAFLYLSIFI